MQSWSAFDTFLIKYPCETASKEGISSVIVDNLLQGNFQPNLKHTLCEKITSSLPLEGALENNFKVQIEDKLNLSSEDPTKCYEIFCLGVTSLQLFVQLNWTGPLDVCKNELPFLFWRKSTSTDFSKTQFNERLYDELLLDGESISSNVKHLELLIFARAVLFAKSFEEIVSANWWRLRCLFVHQQILEERSPTLYNQLGHLVDQLSQNESLLVSSSITAQLQLEAASVWLYYGHVGKAHEAIKSANKLLGLDVRLVGALGKRTKFQEKELAQLTLRVNVDRDRDCEDEPPILSAAEVFPKDVKLEDDVRLSQISFSDSSISDFPQLTEAEQASVLAMCIHKQKSQPKDKLQTEEVMPFLTCLTSQPKVWVLQMSALLHRTKLDSEHKRTVERALIQFQNLSDSISSEQPSASCRLAWLYGSYLPPAWKIEALLANTYISLGMVQTALDVFLKLQLWEEVIACYNLLKLRHKAAEIIQQELEKKQTVKLLCLLGDATDDIDCYQQAWKLSGERSAMAKRHWGMYYFTRKQYAESIPHLEKSVSLNSLQEALWFRLGYAALVEKNWDLCATAYRRYCSLEPECFEAWNNLSKAYVKTGQKPRAFRALQEAVKCNYENWKVWDNLMAVSTDCGQFDEVIRCYHRILDLKEKHIDLEVLKILTNVILNNLVDSAECPTAKLRKQSLTLFGRLTSQVLNNSTLWQLYAQVAASDEPTPENRTKVAQCLQKAYRAATQGSWEQDTATCQQVIDLCIDLADAYVQCSRQCDSSNEKFQMLHSAKLPLKSVLSKVEKEQSDLVTEELPESLAVKYKALLKQYEDIVDELKRLKT